MLDHVPYEIFAKIIKSSYTHYLTRFFPSDSDEISLPPIRATHVCRAWRTALLSDPTMWTCIILKDETPKDVDQLKEMLFRSRSVPLDVFIEYWSAEVLDPPLLLDLLQTTSVLSQALHRCRQLQIIIATQLVPVIFYCFNQPVPLLQEFSLEILEDEGDLKRKDVLRAIHYGLFSGYAPNLKHVCLEIATRLDDLQLSVFKNLSYLRLRFSNAVIHGDVLLDILQLSPCLHILNILMSSRLRQEAVPSMASSRRISLPYLQELTLRGPCEIDIVNLFLRHLDFPIENVKFHIECADFHSRIPASTPLLDFLTQWHFTSLSIHLFSGLTFDFDEGTSRILSPRPKRSSTFRTMYNTTRAPLNHLPNFLRTFNLADITCMYLECISLKPAFLRSILALFENVQYLRIYHNPLEYIPFPGGPPMPRLYLKALIPRLQRSDTQGQPDSESETDGTINKGLNTEAGRGQDLFPCPSLGTLELLFRYEELPVRLDEDYLRALSQCFRIREQAGYPFRLIANCDKGVGLAEDFETLRAHEGFPIEVRSAGRDTSND